MTKNLSLLEVFVFQARRFGNLLFYALMGRNPLKEEARWAEYQELVARMPRVLDAAVAEGLRNRQIARYMDESRN